LTFAITERLSLTPDASFVTACVFDSRLKFQSRQRLQSTLVTMSKNIFIINILTSAGNVGVVPVSVFGAEDVFITVSVDEPETRVALIVDKGRVVVQDRIWQGSRSVGDCRWIGTHDSCNTKKNCKTKHAFTHQSFREIK
jgi:hypothetical protein